MTKPLIFTISAVWDDEAAVWTGHCDDIPAAADAPTLDELLAKISAMALDLLPDNHPGVDPASSRHRPSNVRTIGGRSSLPAWARPCADILSQVCARILASLASLVLPMKSPR